MSAPALPPPPHSLSNTGVASSLTHIVDVLTRQIVEGRPVVVIGGNVAGLVPFVAEYRALGAGPILLLGTWCSPAPDPSLECTWHVPHGVVVRNAREETRIRQGIIDQPPSDVVALLDRFDPDRRAVVVILSPMIGDEFCGREVFGGRPRSFGALEDKTLCDAVWDAAHIPRREVRIPDMTSDDAAILEACAEVESAHGTVWGVDGSHGMRGGGEAVWWVPPTSDPRAEGLVRRRAAAARAITQRLRIMPFLAGVPSSIHGLVLPDGVAVSRPTEMIVLHHPDPQVDERFVFAGTSMLWDPAPAVRAAMVDATRRVGEHLRERYGYRGFFGIDGVATATEFLPHELNSRFTAGLWKGVWETGLPLFRLHGLVLRGEEVGLRCDDVETEMVAALDFVRPAGCSFRHAETPWEKPPQRHPVRPGPDGTWGRADVNPHLVLTLDAAPNGGTRVSVDLTTFPRGDAVAPALAAALRYLAGEVGLEWPDWTTS